MGCAPRGRRDHLQFFSGDLRTAAVRQELGLFHLCRPPFNSVIQLRGPRSEATSRHRPRISLRRRGGGIQLARSIDREYSDQRNTNNGGRLFFERGAGCSRGGWRSLFTAVFPRRDLGRWTKFRREERASYVDSARKRVDCARNSSGGISTTLPSRQM